MSKLDIDLGVLVGQYRQWVHRLLTHPDACEWVLQHERIHNDRPDQIRIDSVRIEDDQFVVTTFNVGMQSSLESLEVLRTEINQSDAVPLTKLPAPDLSHEYVVDPLAIALAAIQRHESGLEARAL